jgi:aryl-alcohol dehydrogenase-like predicted oxidoreductase
MQYVKLGSTGIDVSRICLGCMSYGDPKRGAHEWSLDEEASRPFFRRAVEAGINFFDTANVYSAGSSEEITGRALADFAHRDEIVLATKVNGQMRPGPNGGGLSRKAIFAAIDASLTRLGTDYVDLYQIHRWDRTVPIEETLEALHDVVKAGKARYIGASSMWAWQFSKALHLADRHGWTRFVTMQNHYNLIYREEEREMLPLCVDEGIGVIPWSPLARGRLTRDWDAATAGGSIRTRTRPSSNGSPRSPHRGVCPERRWPWPGCSAVRAWPPRLSERRKPSIWRTPSRRSISS